MADNSNIPEIEFETQDPIVVRVRKTEDRDHDGFSYHVIDEGEFRAHVDANFRGQDPRQDSSQLPSQFVSHETADGYEDTQLAIDLYLRGAEIRLVDGT